MADNAMFETRLAAALARYADLAPTLDDEAVAQEAIAAGRPGRFAAWLSGLRAGPLAPLAPRGLQLVYLLVLVGLLLAALVVALVAGNLRQRSSPLPGANGAIVYSFTGQDHEAVANVAIGPGSTQPEAIAGGRCPAWSADGSVLAWVTYEGTATLVIAGPDGTPTDEVLLVEAPKQSVSFALSPDGRRVAWFKPAEAGSELWVAPVDGTPGARVVEASGTAGTAYDLPAWSPDGRFIAYGAIETDSPTGESRRSGLFAVAADGSDLRTLTRRTGPADDGFAWSPDSRSVGYTGIADDPAGTTDLYAVAADGADDRQLTDTPASEHDAKWSPDGAFLAYEISTEASADRLATLRMDGAGPAGGPLIGPESDWFVWSPDGRLLLWQVVVTAGNETFRTALHSIDREFKEPSATVQVVEGLIVCPPSWQRLGP
jgi:hypothetical protein